MKKGWIWCILLALLLVGGALAQEDVSLLPGVYELKNLPADETYTVYSGPGEDYLIGGSGKASVSTNGYVGCYGQVEDGWIMVRYEVSRKQERIGYIHAPGQPWTQKVRQLTLAQQFVILSDGTELTDDPIVSHKTLCTVSGEATLMAWRGSEWAYVDALADGTGQRVRGFVKRSAIVARTAIPEMDAHPSLRVEEVQSRALKLPENALADGMEVHPLADGTLLIAYWCEGSDKLWMRVISAEDKKLFAKSVPENFLAQVTVTAEGFICEAFDDSEICSGTRYTYTCKGRKWKSAKMKYVDDPDRFYSHHTPSWTIRHYPFGEGAVVPLRLENRLTGVAQEIRMNYGSRMYFMEHQGTLLVHAEEEDGTMALRAFDQAGQLMGRMPSPVTEIVEAGCFGGGAVSLVTGWGESWVHWRIEEQELVPYAFQTPIYCDLLAVTMLEDGVPLMALSGADRTLLCTLEGDTLLQAGKTLGRMVWAGEVGEDGCFPAVVREHDGFELKEYRILR